VSWKVKGSNDPVGEGRGLLFSNTRIGMVVFKRQGNNTVDCSMAITNLVALFNFLWPISQWHRLGELFLKRFIAACSCGDMRLGATFWGDLLCSRLPKCYERYMARSRAPVCCLFWSFSLLTKLPGFSHESPPWWPPPMLISAQPPLDTTVGLNFHLDNGE
jgi:hypothetical protein